MVAAVVVLLLTDGGVTWWAPADDGDPIDHVEVSGGKLVIDDGDAYEDCDEYCLLLVEQVVDCLGPRRSSKPKKANGEVKKAVHRTDALPAHLPAFRLPQFPGDEIGARLLWSEDPAAVPRLDP